jgi:hypothetical protein
MNSLRLDFGIALVATLGAAPVNAAHAQASPAVDHATRVLDLLEAGKFEEVVAEFNAKMAAAMSVQRLRDTWTTISRQLGARTSIITQREVRQPTGNVTVVNGCQFEKAALNVMLSFDAENKIAGMNITPRTPPAVTSAVPASTRFTKEPVTVGAGEWALPGTLSMPVGPVAAAIVLVLSRVPRNTTCHARQRWRVERHTTPNISTVHPRSSGAGFRRTITEHDHERGHSAVEAPPPEQGAEDREQHSDRAECDVEEGR